MKKNIALTLATFSLLATSCSKSPHLGGDWQMGGPMNGGMACQILQTGTNLTFVNEKGEKCNGVLQTKSKVVALDWGGLVGDLTNDATRINWKNGTWWLKK